MRKRTIGVLVLACVAAVSLVGCDGDTQYTTQDVNRFTTLQLYIEPATNEDNYKIVQDTQTGCQYIQAYGHGGMTPLLDATGKYVGCGGSTAPTLTPAQLDQIKQKYNLH